MFIRKIAIAIILISFSFPAAAERRVALVLGNGAYTAAPKLDNPARDAEAIAAMLKRQDFEVVLAIDQDRDGMFSAIDKFAELARGADAALFYYAGHGLQIDGKNLLVPVEAQIRSELDAARKTVEVDTVLNQTMSDAKVKIVLLDACRENPFSTDIANDQQKKTRAITVKGGLAEMKPGKGSVIQFATAAGALAVDGKVGEHSPFTKAILNHLAKADVEIQHALTMVRAEVNDDTRGVQQPWYSTNITGFFYMKQEAGQATPATPTAATTTMASSVGNGSDAQKELLYWDTIKSSTNPDDFKLYIKDYPNGTFVGLARNRIASLERTTVVAALPAPTSDARGLPAAQGATAPGAATRPTASIEELRTTDASQASEDAIGLSRDAWKDIQARLSVLVSRRLSTDGKPGGSTRAAVSAWQTARGYKVSGFFNKIQHEALVGEQVSATALARALQGSDDGDEGNSQDSSGGQRRGTRSASGGSGSNGGAGDAAVKEVIRQGVGAIGRKMGIPW